VELSDSSAHAVEKTNHNRVMPSTPNHLSEEDIDSLYTSLADGTDTLAIATVYLELSFTRYPLAFWWDYYDYAVEEQWLEEGGTVETRPSTPAPPELERRLHALTAEHACTLHADLSARYVS
jgi:hypothetical protein